MRYKTWVVVSKKAVRHNIQKFRSLLNPPPQRGEPRPRGGKTKLWAVVKSNAYGHGLVLFSKLADQYGADGFCVDSAVEGEKLRKEGIRKPILVLGPTFKHQLPTAAQNKLTITISNFDALEEFAKSKAKPDFHLKVDTGMRRQGFYVEELSKVTRFLKTQKLDNSITGVYTHFASAKDISYPTFTEKQFGEFQKATRLLERAGFKQLIKHAAATGGALLNSKYHLDAVRIGIGLYGLWPSTELQIQLLKPRLKPVLSWHVAVSEVKNLKAGDFVGYDLAERIKKPTRAAIIPIGYWHGYPRALSGTGSVLIDGKRAKVLGRVSMDLMTVDATNIKCSRGDRATIIGRQGKEEITAYDIARQLGGSHYEIITRLNPLIERIAV